MSNRSPRRLPEEIYVRRRIAAAIAILVLVALLVWGLVAFAGSGGDDAGTGDTTPAAVTSSAAVSSTSATSAVSSSSSAAEETGSEKPSERPSEEPSEKTSAVAAGDEDACQLADLRITATSDRPSYGPDVQPVFYMTVDNPTKADCVINLDEEVLRFEVYNLASNERVWADTDCYPSVLDGEETFKAGDERSFQAVWSRMSSREGQCAGREPVEPGAYFLHAVIGDNPSDAHTFNLG